MCLSGSLRQCISAAPNTVEVVPQSIGTGTVPSGFGRSSGKAVPDPTNVGAASTTLNSPRVKSGLRSAIVGLISRPTSPDTAGCNNTYLGALYRLDRFSANSEP